MNGKLTLSGPIQVAGFIEDGKITLTRRWLLIGPKPETVLARMIQKYKWTGSERKAAKKVDAEKPAE